MNKDVNSMDFLVNDVLYNEQKTESMLNMDFYENKSSYSRRIRDECTWYGERYMKTIQEIPEKRRDSKSLFKYVFGGQQICKNYSRRNWIWTFSDINKNNILYTLVSIEGVSWEFNIDSKDYDEVIDLRKGVEKYIYEKAVQ